MVAVGHAIDTTRMAEAEHVAYANMVPLATVYPNYGSSRIFGYENPSLVIRAYSKFSKTGPNKVSSAEEPQNPSTQTA